jgi:uncharacterized C2H2 Zn-finger protein
MKIMAGFEKDCPVCNKKFTSLLEYTTHIGKDHKHIPPDRIIEMGKERKYSTRE